MDSCLKVDTTLPQRPSKPQRLMQLFTSRSFFDWVVLSCPTASPGKHTHLKIGAPRRHVTSKLSVCVRLLCRTISSRWASY